MLIVERIHCNVRFEKVRMGRRRKQGERDERLSEPDARSESSEGRGKRKREGGREREGERGEGTRPKTKQRQDNKLNKRTKFKSKQQVVRNRKLVFVVVLLFACFEDD